MKKKRNAKLASLIELANSSDEVLGSNEVEGDGDDNVTEAFSIKADFERQEKKAELDKAPGKSNLIGAELHKNQIVSLLPLSEDDGDCA